MEAVPKLPLISFELKTSPENAQFGQKLKQYILEAYREEPDNYSDEIYQLESLRASAVRPSIDEAGLQGLNRYFFQLRAMQSRFPMGKGQPVALNFSWKDLYANMSCSLADVKFEMACILYNIGALHTRLGSAEPRTSPDSLKAACIHYQNAAWAFQHLSEEYGQPAGVDVADDIMMLFKEICFAQAQECILEKSILDTKKASVIGAVANQVVLFYKNSLAILGPSGGSDNIHETIGTKHYNALHRYLSFKVAYIGCIVYLYQGINAEEQQKMGERVSYYQQALAKLTEAAKLQKFIEPVKVTQEALTFTNDVVEGKRKAAKNENEFVYHEEVPEKDVLAEPKPVCLVKALPINFNDPSIAGTDLFAKLIPMGAHEASSMYSEEKAKLLRHVVNQAETKDTELLEFMSSLQLDQLDVIDSEQRIPQEIVDRCAEMNARADIIHSLVDSMNNLAEIISDVEHSLADCKHLIQDETTKEKEFQKIMGHRPPSIVQTELAREFHKYQEAHARTNESNQVLHKAMTLHIANLKILALPLQQLEAKIPHIDNIEGLDREAMSEMRRVVGKAREMQSQREFLIQELREAVNADDITGALLSRNQTPQEIFKQEIEKHTPKIKIIEQNLAAQENIINALTTLYASYGESRRLLTEVLRKREGLINALITSYDAYEELLAKSQKGLEFYKKLNNNVNQLLTRLKSTCQVQEEERAQLLSKQSGRATSSPDLPVAAKSKPPEIAPMSVSDGKPKLKDYLPYMKNRASPLTGQVPQAEHLPSDTYYPESIYPTTMRPAPVGSEATSDPMQMKYPDGYAMPSQSPTPYNPYISQYNPNENVPYSTPASYAYSNAPKPMGYDVNKIENDMNYGYTTPYTPPQFSNVPTMSPQGYNPYYTASQDSNQYNPGNLNQANMNFNAGQYSLYNQAQVTGSQGYQMESIPEVSSTLVNQPDLSGNFAQMHLTPKNEPKYEHTNAPNIMAHHNLYSSYPQANTVNMSSYSSAMDNTNMNMAPSQTQDLSLNYPYSCEQQPQTMNNQNFAQNMQNPSTGYDTSCYGNSTQSYPIYTNANSITTDSIQNVNNPVLDPYTIPEEAKATLAHLEAMDKPIKSHATGEALNTNAYQNYPSYTVSYTPNVSNQEQNNQPIQSTIPNQSDQNYSGTFQNHPGYGYNNTSGNYEYNYGSQNAYSTYNTNQGIVDPNSMQQNLNVPNQMYTNAGICNTVQSPSEQPQTPASDPNQIYYNNPYGYQTVQPNDAVQNPQDNATNYGANVNQPTYMQSGANQVQDTSVTYSQNQVQTPHENYTSPVIEAPNYPNSQTINYQIEGNTQNPALNYENQVNISTNYQGVSEYQTPSLIYQNMQEVNQNNFSSQPIDQAPSNYQADNNVHGSTNYQTEQTGYKSVTTLLQNNSSNCNVGSGSYQQIQNLTNDGGNQCNYQINQTDNQSSAGFSQHLPSYNQTNNFQSNTSGNQNKYVNSVPSNQNINQDQTINIKQEIPDPPPIKEEKPQPPTMSGALDLLSGIDFSVVDQKPLQPEIKVPQISEISIVKKPVFEPAQVFKPQVIKEEVIQRPAKRDLFSDPGLLNRFTEQVKGLQRTVDSLTNVVPGGLTLLDSKWKHLQDVQLKENMNRTKTIAMQNSSGNILTEVVPFDDSRLTLKSSPEVYFNASYYKQLASWCIPLVISKLPQNNEVSTFWRGVIENKIACIVCLVTEMEMQGYSYWPAGKGFTMDLSNGLKVTLDDVTCTVHWIERKLTVTDGQTVFNLSHYQINVYPAKIICSPLVLLTDKVLGQTFNQRLSNQLNTALIHCKTGAGRSSVLALLCMSMCQVRAGQIALCDSIDAACVNLYKHRSNVLEDTKYLADAYRAILFYVQGVLCSGKNIFAFDSTPTCDFKIATQPRLHVSVLAACLYGASVTSGVAELLRKEICVYVNVIEGTTMFNGEAIMSQSGASIPPPITPSNTNPNEVKPPKFSKESFEEMRQSPSIASADMKDPLNFLDPLWSLKKK